MTAEEYVKTRLDAQIEWYDRKSVTAQRSFKALRLAEIVCAALIPLLSGYVDTNTPTISVSVGILGAAVAVVAGVLGLYQFERNWVEYRATCESMKKLKFLFLTGAEPFNQDPARSYDLLVQRVEALVSKETAHWAHQRLKPTEEASNA